jgi:hypothetical protein
MKSKIAMIALMSVALAACNPQQPQVPQQFENPIQQAPVPVAQDGFDGGDAALGAVAGAAAGYMMGKGSSSNKTVIVDRRPIIVQQQRPGYGYNQGYGRRTTTVTKTTTIKRGFGGTVTKTVTKTKRRR